MELVFEFPTKDTPGFLKRQREAVRLKNEIEGKESEEAIDKLVAFLVRYVKEPADAAAAADAVWDMSEDQFNAALGHLAGGSVTPPKVSEL